MKIVRSQGRTAEKILDLNDLQIPDLWHLGQALKGNPGFQLNNRIDPSKPHDAGVAVIEVWHLAHDLKKNLERLQAGLEKLVATPYTRAFGPGPDYSWEQTIKGLVVLLKAGARKGEGSEDEPYQKPVQGGLK